MRVKYKEAAAEVLTRSSATWVCSCTPLYFLDSAATSLNIFSLLNSAPSAILSLASLQGDVTHHRLSLV